MKRRVVIFLFAVLSLVALPARSQIYRGGTGDGLTAINAGSLGLSVSGALYKGGSNDGYAVSTPASFDLSSSATIYKGGSNDGYAIISPGSFDLSNSGGIYKGGSNDGYAIISAGSFDLSITGGMYKGGSHKGENQLTVPGVNLDICGDTLVWNGNYDTNWDNTANWDCGKLPTVTSIVLVPSAKPRYPVIRFDTEIRKLDIRSGASVLLNAGKKLILNGH